MKPLFYFLLFACSLPVYAQYDGNANDWIDYSKTYYKLRVEENGVYRLSQADLLAAGITSSELIGANLQLWHNGEQVPVFVSTNGSFSTSDFVEFVGFTNDGELDTPLYENPDWHWSKLHSMFDKVGTYFLTLNTGTNLRYSSINNDLTSLPAKEEFYYQQEVPNLGWSPGEGYALGGVVLYDSRFNIGEGKASRFNSAAVFNIPTTNIYPTGDVEIDFIVSPEAHRLSGTTNPTVMNDMRYRIGSSSFKTTSYPRIYQKNVVSDVFSVSELSEGTSTLRFQEGNPGRVQLYDIVVSYPREFTFTEQGFYQLQVRKSGRRYYELSSISSPETVLPIYDLSSNERITPTVEPVTKFSSSTSSTDNHFVFDTNIESLALEQVSFENHANENIDLLVVYHPSFDVVHNGENLLEKYIAHKQSEIGGQWSVKTVNVFDVYNQYAFGINSHDGAIKNFIQELKQEENLPSHVFFFGKGLEYRSDFNNTSSKNLIHSFGHPASDNALVSDYYSETMLCPVGRISVSTLDEMDAYLDKVIEYETAQSQTSDDFQTKEKIWMKESLHLGGGRNDAEQNLFVNYLSNYETRFNAPFYGGKATSIFKSSTDPIETVESVIIDSLMNRGISIITYFGHAGSTSLEFDIQNPDVYSNQGKYPLFLTNGCIVGNLFASSESLAEDYVKIPNKGAIAFIGPTNFGIASAMNNISSFYYRRFAQDDYYGTVGRHLLESTNQNTSSSVIIRFTKQQMVLNGDPTLKLNPHEKTDYLITEEDVRFDPSVITADNEEFKVIATITNIGMAIDEPITIRLTRTLPNGEIEEYNQEIDNVYYQKEVEFTVPTNALVSEGINQFSISIDPENDNDEITRANNNLLNPIEVPISASNVIPVIPYEYAIIDHNTLKLTASSVTNYSTLRTFEMEIDTTELFNSPFKRTTSLQSFGGQISWEPNIPLVNESVYYWRSRLSEPDAQWASSSFVFYDDFEKGWNQSHYYQFLNNDYEQMQMQENRQFGFSQKNRLLTVNAANRLEHGTSYYTEIAFYLDAIKKDRFRCANFAVVIFDPSTGEPIPNPSGGDLGSNNCNNVEYIFPYLDRDDFRKRLIDNILDNPDLDDHYILIYTQDYIRPSARDWAGDTDLYGYNLLDKLEEHGANLIRSHQDDNPYIFFFQKGNPDFEYQFEKSGTSPTDVLRENLTLPTLWSTGTMQSDLIGPALSWDKYQMMLGNPIDGDATGDEFSYTISGINFDGNETTLFSNETLDELDLSSIDATTFPYLKLYGRFTDGQNQTSPQLDFWRIVYEKVPELAINISDFSQSLPIEVNRGQNIVVNYKIENIGGIDMSPVLVKYTIRDASGNTNSEEIRYEALPANGELDIEYEINTSASSQVGINAVIIEVNPNDDQVEQHQFNNIGFFEYKVEGDLENPYLDVTFDGIHIIDGDLVGDEPDIIISVSDENIYLPIDNDENFKILIKHESDADFTTYTSADPTVTFYPADESNLENENQAIIEFKPTLIPGNYEMIVQATDASNNAAGDNDYRISFEVTEEDIITRVVNYPNPFSTRTEFVANIIGEAPDYILIQIFAPNGQVVNEIQAIPSQISVSTGNNFYKLAEWDGTDQYGDPIGNGVYYYKVTMKRGGQVIEPTENNSMSKYFHNGIGKLYIVR